MDKGKVLKRISEQAIYFNDHVDIQAMKLLADIKEYSPTYGEIKLLLQDCKRSLKWSDQDDDYHRVIDKATLILEKEIDAITHK